QVQALAPEDPRGLALCETLQSLQEGQRRRSIRLRAGAATFACAGIIGVGALVFGGAPADADALTASLSTAAAPATRAQAAQPSPAERVTTVRPENASDPDPDTDAPLSPPPETVLEE